MLPNRERFFLVLFGWMGVVLVGLSLLEVFSYELFFVASLVGLLASRELTRTFHVTSPWQRKAQWLTVVGLIGFGLVLVRNFLALLPPGLF